MAAKATWDMTKNMEPPGAACLRMTLTKYVLLSYAGGKRVEIATASTMDVLDWAQHHDQRCKAIMQMHAKAYFESNSET